MILTDLTENPEKIRIFDQIDQNHSLLRKFLIDFDHSDKIRKF